MRQSRETSNEQFRLEREGEREKEGKREKERKIKAKMNDLKLDKSSLNELVIS